MAQTTTTWFGGDIGEGRRALEQLTEATHASNMGETIKQVLLQLRREMERQGLESFTYSDIRICAGNEVTR
ncbi:MAG: hypothetical protein KY445_00975 [Armatimonadetes bacterium]|nr:hypothetical protein [Armatimonadota bacterium]